MNMIQQRKKMTVMMPAVLAVLFFAAGCVPLEPKPDYDNAFNDAVRNDKHIRCRLSAKKAYDAGEMTGAGPARYDYVFTCEAKQDVVLSDILIVVGEVVTARNTGVGKDEKNDRRLDSDRVNGPIRLKAGETYEKKGRLTRKHSIEGSRGYIELEGRVQLPGNKGKPASSKTFLHLKVPVAG